jgi:hypothetical protein
MIPDSGSKPESEGKDPEQLSRLLDTDLAQKRLAWKQAAARRQKVRVASFFSLFFLIVVLVFVLYIMFARLNEERANPRGTPPPSVLRH